MDGRLHEYGFVPGESQHEMSVLVFFLSGGDLLLRFFPPFAA